MIEVSFDAFYKEVIDVFKNPHPWAHIRYGDGEGIVLSYPEFTSKQKSESRWKKWLGTVPSDMSFLAEKIRESIRYADIVGLPCKRHQNVNQDWRNVKKFIISNYKLLSSDRKVCCMDWTVDLQRNNLYDNLLNNKKKIYYVSSRDMTSIFKNRFKIKNVIGFHLSLQHNPKIGESLTDIPHYPVMYNQIINFINTQDIKNQIFLIGAGGLGKIYCMEVKKAGGIALDIGSLFDGWKGYVTRSYLKDGHNYKL